MISDKFVEAIEEITNNEHIVKRKTRDGREVMVKEPIWNCTNTQDDLSPSPPYSIPLSSLSSSLSLSQGQ